MKLTERSGLNYSGIYLIKNIKTKRCYVGQAKHIGKRIYSHLRSTSDETKSDYNYPLHRAIRKYGLDNFELEILERCLPEELNEKEQYWIAKFNCKTNGYNQTDGGYQSIRFIKLTKESVNLIIYYLKNTALSFDKIAEKFNICVGSISKINCGLMWHDNSISYPIRKENKVSIGHFNGIAIAQIDPATDEVVKIYPSLNVAAQAFKNYRGATGSISRCCRGLRKTLFGYKWKQVPISEEDWLNLLKN